MKFPRNFWWFTYKYRPYLWHKQFDRNREIVSIRTKWPWNYVKNFDLVTYRRRDQTTCLCFWSLLGSYLKSWHQRHSLNSHLDYLEQMWLKIRSKKEVEIQSSHILYLNQTIPKMDNEIINFTTYFGLIFNVINMFS